MNLENFSIKDKITQCYLQGMTQQEAMDTTGKISGYVSKVYSSCIIDIPYNPDEVKNISFMQQPQDYKFLIPLALIIIMSRG